MNSHADRRTKRFSPEINVLQATLQERVSFISTVELRGARRPPHFRAGWQILLLRRMLFCGQSGSQNIYQTFYRCTVHFDIYKVHSPTNALFIKLDKVLKFTKNHFYLLLHISVYDRHQGTFIRA